MNIWKPMSDARLREVLEELGVVDMELSSHSPSYVTSYTFKTPSGALVRFGSAICGYHELERAKVLCVSPIAAGSPLPSFRYPPIQLPSDKPLASPITPRLKWWQALLALAGFYRGGGEADDPTDSVENVASDFPEGANDGD